MSSAPLASSKRGVVLRSLRSWHRTVGVVSALFVALLAVTGLLLNHSPRLQLAKRYVQMPLLLDLYHIELPEETVSFQVGDAWVSQVGERLYLNSIEVADFADRLIGTAKLDDTIVIGVPNQLLFLNAEGRLVEKLGDADGVPAGMRRLGLTPSGELVIEAAHGTYIADLERLAWRHTDVAATSWSRAAPLPPAFRERLARAYRGSGLPLERVLLDVHSGRILGTWGVYLVDAMAVLFVVLAATGFWMWMRRNT
ncbi:MAG: PepSY-associated TM helix domain-containing protein [Gammaproteobacteria bacterium]